MESVLLIDKKDNLVTCLRNIIKGEKISVDGAEVIAKDDIPIFHKMAINDIEKGGYCYKYGQIIGTASKEIKRGDYVHVHNCESTHGRGDKK